MRATEFLSSLEEAMPRRNELEKYGLGPEEINAIQASFKFIKRAEVKGSEFNSELERMIIENDCSAIELGLIRFLPKPVGHLHGVQIADCEADAIVVVASGEVVMCDHGDHEILLNCASNSERFLDALDEFIQMRNQKLQWKGRLNEAASRCAERAGGERYIQFYRMLCGFFS